MIARTISIPEDQNEWLNDNSINLSDLVRKFVTRRIEGEIPPGEPENERLLRKIADALGDGDIPYKYRIHEIGELLNVTPGKYPDGHPFDELVDTITTIRCLPRDDFAGGMMFWCPHCKEWHKHGKNAGHRGAHCVSEGSPYAKEGYIIEMMTQAELDDVQDGIELYRAQNVGQV